MRGFFGGLIIGLITLTGAVVVLSLLSSVARTPDVAVNAPASAGGDAQSGSKAGVNSRGNDGDLVELAPTAPGSGDAATDDLSKMDGADTLPSDKPRVGAATAGLSGPGAAAQEVGVEVNSDVAVATAPLSEAPNAPQGDTKPKAISNPTQPALPDVSQTGSGFGVGNAEAEPSPEIVASTDQTIGGTGAASQATAPGTESTPDPSTTPAVAPAGGAGTSAGAPVPDLAQKSPQEPAVPRIAALPQANAEQGSSRPRIGTPIVPLTERVASYAATTPVSEASPGTPTGPPIEAFRTAFYNPDNKPVMAIVLIDDKDAVGAEALADFPYPLTFAIDPSSPDAAIKMTARRAAGFEVVALIDLPRAATAQDAEVTLSVWLQALPEAVAVLEGTGSGIQGSRDVSDQVTDIADAAGLGLIMQSKGLNTAHKLAARAGVPSGLVFRDFDGDGQSPDAIRRFLDQAAFRAGQQGGVIMLGRVRPDTISALLLWGLQDRASRVALAPVSAVLLRAP